MQVTQEQETWTATHEHANPPGQLHKIVNEIATVGKGATQRPRNQQDMPPGGLSSPPVPCAVTSHLHPDPGQHGEVLDWANSWLFEWSIRRKFR